MKLKHKNKKSARRPFTGVKPNKNYNWHLSELTIASGDIHRMFIPPLNKLPKPTYKNK